MSGDENRMRLILGGGAAIVSAGLVFSVLLVLRTKLGGFLGEWITMVMGVLTTPFFMEAFFAVMGLVLVCWINHRRRVKEGDEFVDLSKFDESEEIGKLKD